MSDENISVIKPEDKSQLQIGHGKPGPGAKKGVKRTKYVTINSILDSIQESLGCSYQEALADMLYAEREKYLNGDDEYRNYPKLLMSLANKVVEQARQMPEASSSEIESLTDEELAEKQRQAVIEYIKQNGIPRIPPEGPTDEEYMRSA